jgi:hypothetical protein
LADFESPAKTAYSALLNPSRTTAWSTAPSWRRGTRNASRSAGLTCACNDSALDRYVQFDPGHCPFSVFALHDGFPAKKLSNPRQRRHGRSFDPKLHARRLYTIRHRMIDPHFSLWQISSPGLGRRIANCPSRSPLIDDEALYIDGNTGTHVRCDITCDPPSSREREIDPGKTQSSSSPGHSHCRGCRVPCMHGPRARPECSIIHITKPTQLLLHFNYYSNRYIITSFSPQILSR